MEPAEERKIFNHNRIRNNMRGPYGDPPTSNASVELENMSCASGSSEPGNISPRSHALEEYNNYGTTAEDVASMSTVPIENSHSQHHYPGQQILPGPSVLRNGNNNNNSHMQGNYTEDSSVPPVTTTTNNSRDLRSKRITSTRRISNHVDNYPESGDDCYSEESSATGGGGGGYNYSRSSAASRGSSNRTLYMKTVAVLVGVVAILGLVYHEEMQKTYGQHVSGSSQSRVLKQGHQAATHAVAHEGKVEEAVPQLSEELGESKAIEEETEEEAKAAEEPSERTLKGSSDAALDATRVTQEVESTFIPPKDAPAITLKQGHHSLETTDYQHTATHDFLDDFDQRRRRAADLPDGTIFTEPAHTRMCRTIIERLDAYDAGVTSFEQMVFTESEYVCRDPDSPHTSVMNMFAAQLLDAANNNLGLNVDYTHRCAKWEVYCTGNMTTIQMHLPDPLMTNAYAFQPGCVDGNMLRTICAGSLASDDPTDPDNVLFPTADTYLDSSSGTPTCNLGCYFSQVLPWLRNNLRHVATTWLNTVETRALTFWLRNAQEFSHREKDDMEVSVVSLSCANDGCDMSQATCDCQFDPLPNWVYAMHVPRSSTNVAIVVSPTCAKFGEGCTLHAQELYHFLGQLYPRADITYNVITSTSSWYMRMITADHLVCPPGVGCLLPAIARDAYTYVYENTAPISTWLTCTPQEYLNRLTLPSFPPNFVQGDCRHLRARIGAWAEDLVLAEHMQYNTPVDGYLGCADTNYSPSAEDPYRAPTTYRWDENVWATCPIETLHRSDLCTQMQRLGLDRILFVGDHTTMTQAISLAALTQVGDDISLDPNVVPNFSKTVNCATTGTTFDITYIRNDLMMEPGTTPSPGNPNCGPSNEQYCYPWSTEFSSYATKQLLVMNTGYHWGEDWAGYIENFQNFVGQIDTIAASNPIRQDDVLMFRTSVPGHKECDLHGYPYAHYGEYCPRIVNGAFWHWWGELPPYNDYAIRIINEWNLLNTVKSGPDIELLDPWMMSILRPDGHLSGADAGPNCSIDPQECMLYSLPGPVDWWNHLLLMQLTDIGTHLENNNPMQAWR